MTAFLHIKVNKNGLFILFFRELLQICVDKSVYISVHYRVNASVLKTGSRILCESVGHEDVASNLAAPLNVCLALYILDPVELSARRI